MDNGSTGGDAQLGPDGFQIPPGRFRADSQGRGNLLVGPTVLECLDRFNLPRLEAKDLLGLAKVHAVGVDLLQKYCDKGGSSLRLVVEQKGPEAVSASPGGKGNLHETACSRIQG